MVTRRPARLRGLLALVVLSGCGGGGEGAAASTAASTTIVPAPTTSTVPATTVASTSTTVPVPLTTAVIDPAQVLILGEGGLGPARFGEGEDAAIAAVGAVLGPPDSDSGWVASSGLFGACPGTEVRGVGWHDLLLLFGDDSPYVAAPGPRHLFAWRYGNDGSRIPVPSGLHTAKQITVGSTVAELRGAYGAGLELSDAVAGGPAGFTIGAALSGAVTTATDDGLITFIQGGALCGN